MNSECIVDYELSSTLGRGYVMPCLKRALSVRKPETINSNHVSHFTNPDYLNLLESRGIRISMDSKGQALDNVRTKCFFRSLKCDDIYINEYDMPVEFWKGINVYIREYNTYRLHDSFKRYVPANIYRRSCTAVTA